MIRAAVWAALAIALAAPAEAAAPPAPGGANGMVASAQRLASEVGVAVLKRGGNAVDAAVAVGYALAVVLPADGNLGGGGFMTIVFADGRKTFIDFREKAPLKATRDMFLGPDGAIVKGLSTRGFLSVGVPGTVGGLEYAREKYGTLSRADLLDPAIGYAENGFTLDDGDARLLDTAAPDLRGDPAAAAIFLNDGRPFAAGERLVQKNLARTLRAIRDRGAAGFYEGEVGGAIAAAEAKGGGIITAEDLHAIKPRELAPITCDYRGYAIVAAPPPSSGGVTLCEMFNILEGYPLKELGFGSAQALHDEIETMRHAYVDRNNLLGDPAFVKNPVDQLTSKDYAAKIRAAIDPAHATRSADLGPGKPPHEGIETTHYSIVDKDGDAVAVTYSLNDAFGAKVVAGDTGVLLNDTMDDFTAKVGAANIYGLVQGEKNAIEPGKTPLSSMSPTIVTKDGKPVLVLGTPGGSRIITVVMETILNVIDYGMSIGEAVDAPRIHNQWLPDVTNVEPFAVSPDTRKILEGMGHHLGPPQPVNQVDAILIGAPTLGGKPFAGLRYFGANDPRRGTGAAVGY
jgi:gamma-glutamyltranspeptidase/glutathione hydrolase